MDVEVVVVLRRKPSVLPKDNLYGFDKMKLRKIQKDGWCVAFQLKERTDANFHKVCFFSTTNIYSRICAWIIFWTSSTSTRVIEKVTRSAFRI